MNRRIACIVEGHGEVEAVPVLLRRVWEKSTELKAPDVPRTSVLRVPRSKLVRPQELERTVELAARRVGSDGAILIIIDADDDAPCRMGPELLARARSARSDIRIAVVMAKREYEAWFVAAAQSIARSLGLKHVVTPPNPEAIRDAKGWVAARMPDGCYRETLQQARLTAAMDIDEAAASDSFRKLLRDVRRLLAP